VSLTFVLGAFRGQGEAVKKDDYFCCPILLP
jgi:hypothetical protein